MSEQSRPKARVYREEEVAKILKRAAGLQGEKVRAGPALDLTEIEQIARDAGIDPEVVRRAARELDETPAPSTLGQQLLGAPLKLSIQRTVPGELRVEDHEQVAQLIRDAVGGVTVFGQVSVIGKTLSFNGLSRSGPVEISVSSREGATTLKINVSYSNLAGGLFGGLIGGVGGGLGGNVVWLLPMMHYPVVAGLAGALGVTAGAWLLARSLFTTISGRNRDAMRKLADTLEQLLRQQALRPAT